jgi:hypothetical protein
MRHLAHEPGAGEMPGAQNVLSQAPFAFTGGGQASAAAVGCAMMRSPLDDMMQAVRQPQGPS